jgi:hypothetical protein
MDQKKEFANKDLNLVPPTLPELPYFATDAIPSELIWVTGLAQNLAARWLQHTQQNGGVPKIENDKREDEAPADKLLSVVEAATMLGTTANWIYANAEKLGAFRISHKKMRIPEKALRLYLARKRAEGG